MFYYKLIRDKVPQLIKQAGKKPITETIEDDAEFRLYLERKLDEEVQEYHESGDPEELADILEVVMSIAEARGIKYCDLMDMTIKKGVRNGRFSSRTLLVRIDEPGRSRE